MTKYLKIIERSLLLIGFGLLVFCAAAKLHEKVLSRASIRQFEQTKNSPPALPKDSAPTLRLSGPSFLLWSNQRIKHYKEALNQHVASPLAVLRIKRIKLEAPVLEGTDEVTLNRGLGRIAGTAHFGGDGNVGIAGHRDSFFRGLKDVKLRDQIDLEESDRTLTYVVDRIEIVDPRNVSVLRSSSKPTITLVTCYPFYYIGGAPKRYIVHATLISEGAEQQDHARSQAASFRHLVQNQAEQS